MFHETDRSVFSNHQFPVASPWLDSPAAPEDHEANYGATNFARGLLFGLPLSALLWVGIVLGWRWLF